MASGNSNGLGVPGEYDGEGEEQEGGDSDGNDGEDSSDSDDGEAVDDGNDGEDSSDNNRYYDTEADQKYTLSVNEIVKNWEICKYCLSSLCSIIQYCTAECKLNRYRILLEELLLHTYHQGILKRVTYCFYTQAQASICYRLVLSRWKDMKADSAEIDEIVERARSLPITSTLPPIRRSAGLPALACICGLND